MSKVSRMPERLKRNGAHRPPYAIETTITQLFKRYERELVGRYVSDPLGTRVWFQDYNFPKLIQLSFRGKKAKATVAIQHLRRGDPEADYAYDQHRAKTLFWIPEVIESPDSIYVNGHHRIAGDQVYVKRFSKAGAPLKVVFTQIDEDSNQRIVTTSFLTDEDRLRQFVTSPAMWSVKISTTSSAIPLQIAAGEGDL